MWDECTFVCQIQRMEMCTLLAELSESKKQHLEHHNEVAKQQPDYRRSPWFVIQMISIISLFATVCFILIT